MIYAKTALGLEEIKTRQHGLAPRMRQLLILIDGKKDSQTLATMVSGLDFDQSIDALLNIELIEQVGGSPTAQKLADLDHNNESATQLSEPKMSLNDQILRVSRLITETLGPNASASAIRVERCQSIEELRQEIPGLLNLVENRLGTRGLGDFTRQLGDI